MADLGKLLRHNFKMLAAAGCQHIQIDEPLFTMSDEQRGRGRASMRSTSRSKACPTTSTSRSHICQGNYAVGKEYDAQIGHRYFDAGRYKADWSARSSARPIWSSMTWRTTTRACSATGSSASARSTCRIPRSRPGKPWPSASEACVAGAGADHRHQLLRLQSSAAADRLRQAQAMTEAKRILGG